MLAMLSNSELIGPLEVAKFLFSAVYVAATIGVIVGVYWEREEFPKEKRDRGWRLLVRSLAVDTLFTVLILGTDGWIGSIQRAEIIALEMRLAPRILSDAQLLRIVKTVAPFAGQEFQIFTYWDSKEPMNLTNQIGNALLSSEAGWKFIKPASGSWLMGGMEGIQIFAHPDADKVAKDASAALAAALEKNKKGTHLRQSC
jgi:hypothetical protein